MAESMAENQFEDLSVPVKCEGLKVSPLLSVDSGYMFHSGPSATLWGTQHCQS